MHPTIDAPTPASRRKEMESFLTEHAFQLMQDDSGAPFNHEAVAAAAGISARTVYRYFPTQRDLVGAVWRQLRDSTATVWPETEEAILPELRALFAQFERNNVLTRTVIANSSRVNISEHGSAEGRAAFRRALSGRLARLDADAGAQLVAACLAIYSAPFWQMLRDRGQLTPAGAAEAACLAMTAVLRSVAPEVPTRVADATVGT